MPSAEDIIRSLRYLANHYMNIAIVWHLIIYIFLLFILLTHFRPSNRLMGCLLSIPLFSVSFFAWQVNNPFNGLFFLITGLALFFFSYTARPEKIILNPSYILKLTGILTLFFGLLYPHFLGPRLFVYLYAAPTCIIPCPTLLMITGFSMIFLMRQSLRWMVTLLTANLFYGFFGALRLNVYIDGMLLVASAALIIQLILHQNLLKNSYGQSPDQRRSHETT